MSSFALAVAERRLSRFVLWPLALAFSVAAWVSVSRGLWWAAGVFVLLVLYMGWLTSGLASNRGKSFSELRSGIVLPPPPDKAEDVNYEETRELARTTVHVYYALVIGAVVGAVVSGLRFYWVILIAAATWVLAQIAGSLLMALVSSPRLLPRQQAK